MTPYLTYLVHRVSRYGDFHYFSSLLTDQLISQAFFYWPPSIPRIIFHIIRAFKWHLTWPIWSIESCTMVIFIISLLFLLISSFLRHFSIGPQAFLGSYSTSLGLPYLTYLVYRALCYDNFHPFSPLLTNQLISQALGLSNDASLWLLSSRDGR